MTCGTYAKREWAPDYPWAPTREERQRFYDAIEFRWGEELGLDSLAPSHKDDPALASWLATYSRRSATPGAALALARMNTQIDVRHVLPAISVPTLVMHRTGDTDAQVEEGRFIAERIPGARFVELHGDDHLPWIGDQDQVLDEVEEFLTGVRPAPRHDRILATVLFTDIVGSTEHARRLGDSKWRVLLERHHSVVRDELARFRGREIDTAGDGFLASFDGPARAIRCAQAIVASVGGLGLQVRAGLHTGECEVVDGKLVGVAVHIGARGQRGRTVRGAGLLDREGPRRRVRARLRGRWRARAEGRARPVEAVQGGRVNAWRTVSLLSELHPGRPSELHGSSSARRLKNLSGLTRVASVLLLSKFHG
jgi:class 3 adenylate cyclase